MRGRAIVEGLGGCGRATSGTAPFQLPRVEVHVVAAIVLVAADVEKHLHRIPHPQAVGQRSLLLHRLEFDVLGEFAILHLDHEFPLREAAVERLDLVDEVDFAFDFVAFSHGRALIWVAPFLPLFFVRAQGKGAPDRAGPTLSGGRESELHPAI